MMQVSLATLKAWKSAELIITIVRKVKGGVIVRVGGQE